MKPSNGTAFYNARRTDHIPRWFGYRPRRYAAREEEEDAPSTSKGVFAGSRSGSKKLSQDRQSIKKNAKPEKEGKKKGKKEKKKLELFIKKASKKVFILIDLFIFLPHQCVQYSYIAVSIVISDSH